MIARLSGGHPLGPGGVGRACERAERTLSGSGAGYSVRSSVKGHEFSARGGMDGPESLHVDMGQSSFSVSWEATSTFSVPDAMLAVVDGCLGITGEIDVMASVVLTQVRITPPRIGDGSLVRRLAMVTVDLEPPGAAKSAPDAGEFQFTGMAVPSGAETGSLAIFGSRKSPVSGARRALERMLLALSDYHEACRR